MAHPRVFISFDFDNNADQKKYFAGQALNSRTPFNIEDWSSKTALPQKEWEARIEAKINKCNLVVVLIGKKTYTATGVVKEIRFAKSNQVPVFGVYVDGTNTTTSLPDGLPRNRVIPWEWAKIDSAINQCLKEGKNR